MKNNRSLRILSGIVCAVLLLLCFQSCGSAPALSDVQDEFKALIEASFEVNDIFFGEGLEVYDREVSSGDGNLKYDEESGLYYGFAVDESMGKVLKVYDSNGKKYVYAALSEKTPDSDIKSKLNVVLLASDTEVYYNNGTEICVYDVIDNYKEVAQEIVYEDNAPVYYDYVRLDEKYQNVDSIKELAAKVYSTDYLDSVYVTIFDGLLTDDNVIYARYMADESGNTDFLLKSNRFDPYFETQTTYDYSSMKIIKPSDSTSVNITITATGRYIDYETVEIKTGTFEKTLRFVKEADGWRLDTPTY